MRVVIVNNWKCCILLITLCVVLFDRDHHFNMTVGVRFMSCTTCDCVLMLLMYLSTQHDINVKKLLIQLSVRM